MFCKLLIDGLNDHEEKCQFKTSEILNVLFPIVAQQLNQKSCNEILSTILYYMLCICLAFFIEHANFLFFLSLEEYLKNFKTICTIKNVYYIW